MADLFNGDFETSVIGGLLIDPHMLADIRAMLTPSDFYDHGCRAVYETICTIADRCAPVDFMTVADDLEKSAPRGTWLADLALLQRNTPSAANIAGYAAGVAEYSTLRKLHNAGQDVCRACFEPSMTTSEKIARAQQSVLDLINVKGRKGPKTAKEALTEWHKHLEYCHDSQGGLTGISTGLEALDEMTFGLHGGELDILAARPGCGKTVLALNISAACLRAGLKVLFFSLEMQARELVGRMASNMTGTFYRNLQTADLCQEQWSRVTNFVATMRDSGLFIDDDGDVSIADIRARARSQASKTGVDLVIVDYLQLVGGVGENETIKVGSVSRGLKAMAKELDCPVIALSQLNRGLESRTDPRPKLSDLRQSGQIEQDADMVMFLHKHDDRHTELIVEKLRHGQPGSVWLEPQFHIMRFIPGKPFIPEAPKVQARGFK
jgi:replicative DNA helicase